MRLRLQATPEELTQKSPALVGELAKAISGYAPALAEALQKALELPEVEHTADLRHQALKDSLVRVRQLYADSLGEMVEEIGQALDARVREIGGDAVQKGPDYTTEIRSEEQDLLDTVKRNLVKLGYSDRDYAKGGLLHELPIAELQQILEFEGAK